MSRFTNPLARVRVALPCKADWDEMIGTDRVRFCGQCNLNVYNLSAMTREQAESVIAANEGRLCVRFYRRRDGSIITQDCPVGLRAVRARVSYWTKAVVAALLTFFTAIGVETVLSSFAPFEPHVMRTMGMMAMPPEGVELGERVLEPSEEVSARKLSLRPPRRLKKRR